MRFRIEERLVKDETGQMEGQSDFVERMVVEAESSARALRDYLSHQNAELVGMIEKIGSRAIANARRGDTLFVVQVVPKD